MSTVQVERVRVKKLQPTNHIKQWEWQFVKYSINSNKKKEEKKTSARKKTSMLRVLCSTRLFFALSSFLLLLACLYMCITVCVCVCVCVVFFILFSRVLMFCVFSNDSKEAKMHVRILSSSRTDTSHHLHFVFPFFFFFFFYSCVRCLLFPSLYIQNRHFVEYSIVWKTVWHQHYLRRNIRTIRQHIRIIINTDRQAGIIHFHLHPIIMIYHHPYLDHHIDIHPQHITIHHM